ncbi:MAG: N-acetyltransferase [Tepidisphaeraceae bacterium]
MEASPATIAPPLAVAVRAARLADVPRIHEVINFHAELGKMLFKSYADLYENIRDYAVAETEMNGKQEVVGCVALGIIWADMAEVRALAVDERARGRGVGTKLVEWCVADARRMQIRKLMSLTYEERFFAKLGFVVVNKDTLPLKVWTDCVKCPKVDNCDEIAMVRELTDVPILEAPKALPTPRGVSIPVLPYEE